MSDPTAIRLLATEYASVASHRPLPPGRQRDAGYTLAALETLGLVDADDGDAWRARFARLGVPTAEHALMPLEIRRRARALVPAGCGLECVTVRRTLEAVGALSWRDSDEPHDALGLVVDRIVPAPPQPPSDVTIASVVLFSDMVAVHSYVSEPGYGVGHPPLSANDGGGFELSLRDDRGTDYRLRRRAGSSGIARSSTARTSFVPAPPAAAAWVEVGIGEVTLVRVPLT